MNTRMHHNQKKPKWKPREARHQHMHEHEEEREEPCRKRGPIGEEKIEEDRVRSEPCKWHNLKEGSAHRDYMMQRKGGAIG